MPLYEYECENCSHRFEVIQKFSDPPLTECPKCKGPVRKLFSSPAIQFKGSGWYITDYAKKSSSDSSSSSKAAAEKSADAKSDSAKPGSAKSDAAPAPTTTTTTKD